MKKFLKNFFIKLKNKEKNLVKNVKKHFTWDKNLFRKLKKNKGSKSPNLGQLKYFPSVLTKKEKIIFVFWGLLFMSSLFFFVFRVYYRLPLVPAQGGEYTEGIIGQVESINPLFSSRNDAEQDLTRLIFSGLFKTTNQGISHDLVEKWEEKNDGKNYIFYLKKNIFWHDGHKFTADDVIFTITTAQNERVNSPLKQILFGFEVKKINDNAFEIILEKPFSLLLPSLTFGIIPKHLWQNVSFENFLADDLNLMPVGTGPFKIKEKIGTGGGKIKTITLEKNKNYFHQTPHLNKITIKFFDNYEDAESALVTKKIEGLSYVRKISDIETAPKNLNSYKIPLSYYSALFFNVESETLKNKKMREILAHVLNKEEVFIDLKNIEPLKTAIVNPKINLKEIDEYEHSIDLAITKLNELDFIRKEGWFVDKNNTILEIKIIVPEGAVLQKIGQKIKENWEDFGLKTNLFILTKNEFNNALQEKNYDAVLSTIVEGYQPDPFSLWHSTQATDGLNLSNLKDIQINILLEKIRTTIDQKKREEYYQEFQQIISQQIPIIFLYQTKLSYFRDKKINGFVPDYLTYPSDRFNNIESWYVFSKRAFKK